MLKYKIYLTLISIYGATQLSSWHKVFFAVMTLYFLIALYPDVRASVIKILK